MKAGGPARSGAASTYRGQKAIVGSCNTTPSCHANRNPDKQRDKTVFVRLKFAINGNKTPTNLMKTLTPLRSLAVTWVTIAVFLTCLNVLAGPRPRFRLTDLGALPGAQAGGIAYALNDHGDVVGMAVNSNGMGRPFLYRDGRMTDPGTAPGWGKAVAINNAGQIVTHEFVDPQLHSFVIDGERVIDLSAQAGHWASAMSVNKAGVVVGVTTPDGINGEQGRQYNAFSWSNGVFTTLGTPTNSLTAVARDINKRGVIAGQITIASYYHGLDGFRAALFLNTQGTILGLLKEAVGSTATAINDLGDVTGDAYYTPYTDGHVRAFISVRGRMRSIGVLRGDVISNANDINNSRQVVGISQDLVGEPRAFLYSGGQLYDLNDLVKHARGWHFRTANAINNRGQIVGEALVEGGSRPYLLTPVR